MAGIALNLMSRAPVAGATKTRLIPRLGAEGARAFHIACLQDLLEECARWCAARTVMGDTARLEVHIHPADSEPAFLRSGIDWPKGARIVPQRGDTLHERMVAALDAAWAETSSDAPACKLLIGSDLPLLQARHLDLALAALGSADVVLGPATDGGYYLVGLRRRAPGLFKATVPSGPGSELERMLAQAHALGLRPAIIETMPDADTPGDLDAILAHPLAREVAQRRSMRWLRANLAQQPPGG